MPQATKPALPEYSRELRLDSTVNYGDSTERRASREGVDAMQRGWDW
jgi:hypothetical protein